MANYVCRNNCKQFRILKRKMDHNDESYIRTGQKPMKDEFPSNLSQSFSDSLYGSKVMC